MASDLQAPAGPPSPYEQARDGVIRFAVNMERLRKEQHLSQQALADKAELSLAVVSNLSRGLNAPNLTSAIALAAALGTTVDAMTGPQPSGAVHGG